MRSSASARHISATPSSLASEYSWISPLDAVPGPFSRSRSASCRASAVTRAMVSAGRPAASISGGTQSGSGRR